MLVIQPTKEQLRSLQHVAENWPCDRPVTCTPEDWGICERNGWIEKLWRSESSHVYSGYALTSTGRKLVMR